MSFILGICNCGCKESITVRTLSGYLRRFVKGHANRVLLLGEKNHKWKGGRITRHGYIKIYSPNHPYRDYSGYVFEHRLVMEKHLR